MAWTADFETTTDPNDCRVWAYGLCDINDTNNFIYGNNINDFMKWCETTKNDTLYFHNLKFDGEFILYWLFDNNFKHVVNKADVTDNTFTTLISDAGQFYSIEVYFKVQGKKRNKITFYDSYKIIPFGVEDIAKSFKLEIQKLEIDYTAKREINHQLTIQEILYVRNDVTIVAKALKVLFDQQLTKMTQGSNAVYDYKNIVGKKNFERWFPPPDYDHDIRQSYKGGWSYVKPEYAGKDIPKGIVLDVNSLYPSVMYYKPLPYGEGIQFTGKYEEDNLYNVYVQMFKCQFEIKDKHLPTIQIKGNSLSFIPTEYLTDSGDEEVVLCLTSIDLELFFVHYDVYNIGWVSGWKFKSTTGLFNDYIEKWNGVKMQSTIDGNNGMRTLAKLMLNSLYGKFALNPSVQSKIPYYIGGLVKYKLGEKETRTPMYIPVGSFITAWARYITITSAQKVYNRFIYADTDSLHLIGEEIPQNLDVDKVKLGAWKHEETFDRARYLRPKSYIHETDGQLTVTCAGLTKGCHQYVTWDNFQLGNSFDGKLQQNRVKGGIVLKEISYKLKA